MTKGEQFINFIKPTNAREVSCESETHCAHLCENKESELQAEAEEGEVWPCSMVDAGSVSVSGSGDQAEDHIRYYLEGQLYGSRFKS